MFLGRSQKVFDPEKMKYYREKAGISVGELSKITGIKKTTIYRMEREEDSMLNVEHISAIAKVIGCTLEDLLVDGVEIRIRPKDE